MIFWYMEDVHRIIMTCYLGCIVSISIINGAPRIATFPSVRAGLQNKGTTRGSQQIRVWKGCICCCHVLCIFYMREFDQKCHVLTCVIVIVFHSQWHDSMMLEWDQLERDCRETNIHYVAMIPCSGCKDTINWYKLSNLCILSLNVWERVDSRISSPTLLLTSYQWQCVWKGTMFLCHCLHHGSGLKTLLSLLSHAFQVIRNQFKHTKVNHKTFISVAEVLFDHVWPTV